MNKTLKIGRWNALRAVGIAVGVAFVLVGLTVESGAVWAQDSTAATVEDAGAATASAASSETTDETTSAPSTESAAESSSETTSAASTESAAESATASSTDSASNPTPRPDAATEPQSAAQPAVQPAASAPSASNSAPSGDFLALEKAAATKTPEIFAGLKIVKEFSKRLPNYWSVVAPTKKQKESIYAIQKDYFNEIVKLESRIERLEKERDAKMRVVLTDKQREKLDAKLAEVAKKRAEEEAAKQAALENEEPE